MTSLATLRSIGSDRRLTADDIFEAVFAAGSILNEDDREASEALEIAIRLLEARRNGQIPDGCMDAVEYLAEECGLYPYVNLNNFGHLTQSVIEAHAIKLDEKVYLHAKQMKVLLWLLAGDNVILSAPTSFGKSLLVDAFLAQKRPHVVVMILPTIALIDEARRRLAKNFRDSYRIITTVTEVYNEAQPTIFILTQERFLQREDNVRISLLFVDEFYKLDPGRDDGRYETLNLAVYRALPKARQVFMAGPHIRNIDLGPNWTGSFRFSQTNYRTVTVNVVDRSAKKEKLQTFLADLRGVGEQNSLVFTAVPGSAQNLMGDIIEAGINYPSELGAKLGDWIAENYHRDWQIGRGAANGIAVHHGRLPRSLGQLFVRMFDDGHLKLLICTSTLIEGVNTSAANVFIYDKKINKTDFDFFSFANIRGRVGRMMRHFVGNAYLYHEPPAEIETRVDVPVLSDPGSSTDFIVMNVDRAELSAAGKERQDRLPAESGLPREILQKHGVLGVELLSEVYSRIIVELRQRPNDYLWTGFPDREQRKALASLVLHIAHTRRDTPGLHSPGQIGWAWSQLGAIRTFSGYLRWFARHFGKDGDPSSGVDTAFQFLQACEFIFPRSIAAIEALVAHAVPDAKIAYGPFIVSLENWYRPVWMKQIDEAGIPIPLAERLRKHIGDVADKDAAIAAIRALDFDALPEFGEIDRFIIDQALMAA
ncbi:helicase domain-containing protein [Methylorubrum extorquens DSM 13060]|uniref:Helicase domain-containing protein n=1 Tax=Methylorubrum extorquens DSM 13060 TaxID=882800 RepID=H1KQZ7_METEX|nr:helicase domain-containing protein [Methylorubrum extorquens DSM 13060]